MPFWLPKITQNWAKNLGFPARKVGRKNNFFEIFTNFFEKTGLAARKVGRKKFLASASSPYKSRLPGFCWPDFHFFMNSLDKHTKW